jgi:hypothetical protein
MFSYTVYLDKAGNAMRVCIAMFFSQILVFANRVLGHLPHNSCVTTPSLLIPILLAVIVLLAQLGNETVFVWLGDGLALVHKALFQDT